MINTQWLTPQAMLWVTIFYLHSVVYIAYTALAFTHYTRVLTVNAGPTCCMLENDPNLKEWPAPTEPPAVGVHGENCAIKLTRSKRP